MHLRERGGFLFAPLLLFEQFENGGRLKTSEKENFSTLPPLGIELGPFFSENHPFSFCVRLVVGLCFPTQPQHVERLHLGASHLREGEQRREGREETYE